VANRNKARASQPLSARWLKIDFGGAASL